MSVFPGSGPNLRLDPEVPTVVGSTNGASSLVGRFRAGQENWVLAPFHGLKPLEEGRHRDLPLHSGALVGRHPEPVCLLSAESDGVHHKDLRHAQGTILRTRRIRHRARRPGLRETLRCLAPLSWDGRPCPSFSAGRPYPPSSRRTASCHAEARKPGDH